jgi:nucleotide sugar dehydrogenase
MRVCVVALGKMGLPLATQFATKGHRVIGVDINPETVAAVNRGETPFPGEDGLAEALAATRAEGRLEATTDVPAGVEVSEAVVVVVPVIVDDALQPDFGSIDVATASIARGLTPETLVTYETTVPVGTTRQRFAPALATASGLTPGEDLFVAFSPERVSSGRVFADLRRYPKLVGGVDRESAIRAVKFYEAVLDFDERGDLTRPNGVWDLGSADAAEFAKLAETTYRDVNIALANEFARFADRAGVDVYRVIEAANSQPFSHIHQPGVAVGGHCIPVYPRFYAASDPYAILPAQARGVNLGMPAYAVERLAAAIGSLRDLRVAVLGAAYRRGVKETAFSGVFGVVRELVERAAIPMVQDPWFSDDELRGLGFEPYHLGERCDAAIVQTDHAEYASLRPDDLPGIRGLLDGRHVTDAENWHGVPRVVIGAPSADP